MSAAPKIYCDTSTLAPNISDQASLPELDALKQLQELFKAGKCTLHYSHIVQAELERTKDPARRAALKADCELLERIRHDEKPIGFNTMSDHRGLFTTGHFIFQDVHDPKLCKAIYAEIKKRVSRANDFATRRDAQHLAQAIFNMCDYFLTRDVKTIIKPMRGWLEQTYPPLLIRRPSECLADICGARQEATCEGKAR
jgi:hypothetical protein